MTLDEAITDLENCLAEDWPGEWLNVEALELVLKELKATVMDDHKHHPVYRVGELEAELREARARILVLERELEVARSLTKEAMHQVIDRGIFLAPSGVWWAWSFIKPDRVYSLRTKDKATAQAKYDRQKHDMLAARAKHP